MPGTKVKVLREKLIEAIKTRKQEVVEEHKKRVEQYPDELDEYWQELAEILAEASSFVNKGKAIPKRMLHWDSELKLPSKPSKPDKPNVSSYDRDIAVLEMTDEETISITADDYGRYVC